VGKRFCLGLAATAACTCLATGSARAIMTTDNSTNINQLVGANTFYDAGFTGTRAVVADVEAGLVWDGQESLTAVTTQIPNSYASNEFDMHATWVGQSIAGYNPNVGYNPNAPSFDQNLETGIAYGATLWTGAIASSAYAYGGWNNPGSSTYSEGFNVTANSAVTPYIEAMITGINGQTADVVNNSYSAYVPVSESSYSTYLTNGNNFLSIALDAFAYASGKLVVASAGNNGSQEDTVGAPASGINALVVGATTGDTSNPEYGSVVGFSSVSPSDFFIPSDPTGESGDFLSDVRARIDLVAPGTQLDLAHYGGATGGNQFGGSTDSLTDAYNTDLAGTSFSSPITAAGAALVVDAGKALYSSDPNATDGRVLQAVLLNSATPLAGWNNGQNLSGGVVTTTQSLDYAQGAGELNLTNAYYQYTAGTNDVAAPTPVLNDNLAGTTVNAANVQSVGWAFGAISHNTGIQTNEEYLIRTPLQGSSLLTVTLAWYADDTYDPNDPTDVNYGSFDNLDLQVWQDVGGVATTLIAQSDSSYINIQHLYDISLPATGDYFIDVLENNYLYNFVDDDTTDYGLAWTLTPTPEPGTFGLLALGAIALLRRRKTH
jgi:MYXO-CTERM domain-containing protein